MDFSDLKTRAKASMKGHYKDAIILMVIFGVCTSLGSFANTGESGDVNALAAILSLASFVLTCLFTFGMYSFYLKISRNETVDFKELFSKVGMAVDFFIISLVVGIVVFLWTLLLIVPGIIAAIKYSQVFFLKLDNTDMGVKELMDRSKELMNGHKMDYFLLCLSFIGWAILGLFTFGILYFWLVPYYQTTLCNFYNKLLEEKK